MVADDQALVRSGFTMLLAGESDIDVVGEAGNCAEAVALAKQQNPEIAIARKQVEAARGGRVEARSGRLPAVISSGLPLSSVSWRP